MVESCQVQGGSGSNEKQLWLAILITHENDSQAYLFEADTFKKVAKQQSKLKYDGRSTSVT